MLLTATRVPSPLNCLCKWQHHATQGDVVRSAGFYCGLSTTLHGRQTNISANFILFLLFWTTMKTLQLITCDVMGTILKTKTSVGNQYARTAGKILKKNMRVSPSDLDAKFPTVFRDHWQKHPNFGYGSGMSSISWWKSVVKTTFLQARGMDDDHELYHVMERDLDALASELYQVLL